MFIGLPQINPLFERSVTDEINNAFRMLDKKAGELNPPDLEPVKKLSQVNAFPVALPSFQKWTFDKNSLGIREIRDLDENAVATISVVKNGSFKAGNDVTLSIQFQVSESILVPNATRFFSITESNSYDFFCTVCSSENDIPNCKGRIKDGNIYLSGRFLAGYVYIISTHFMAG